MILGTLGFLFKNNHPELVGGEDDPEDGPAVAATVFTAVFIYAVRRKPLSPTAVDEYPADGDVEMDQMGCVEEPQNDDS